MSDIKALVAKARKHHSDSNALKLCWQLADALENYATALEAQQAVVEALGQLDFDGPGDVVDNLEGVLSDWDDHGFDEVDAATLRAVQNQLWAVKKALEGEGRD